jgi:hypothetical protein
LYSFFDGKY